MPKAVNLRCAAESSDIARLGFGRNDATQTGRRRFPTGEDITLQWRIVPEAAAAKAGWVGTLANDHMNGMAYDGWTSGGCKTAPEGRGGAVEGHLEVWSASGRMLLPLVADRCTVGSSAESDL